MNYYEKYVKYKTKYLKLTDKNYLQRGGDIPVIMHPDRINLFADEHMSQYLNPIYGYVMYKTGFILNTYHLNKSGFTDEPISKVIKKCCKIETGGMIRPTDSIANVIKPIDFGRYIAIKYINMTLEGGIIDKIKPNSIVFINSIQTNGKIKKFLTESINKLNKFIPVAAKEDEDYNEKIYFHIILYCMWWTADNDDGITQYYRGVNEVFSIIRQLGSKYDKYKQIDLENPPDNSFEARLLGIVINKSYKKFTIYHQWQAKNFCETAKKPTYSDCGEVTARNLINLLCFNGENFDITILERFSAIPELINYYKTFNTFQRQSIVNISDDPELELNARDAWSRLIMVYAKDNIKFNEQCNDGGEGGGGSKASFGFNVKSGLALDGSVSNFLQLIKNLLRIEGWDNLGGIMTIKDNTDSKGFGYIDITHEEFGEFVIHCRDGHYYMEAVKKPDGEIIYDGLNEEQIKTINRVFSNASINDYMWIKFDPNQIVNSIDLGGSNEIKLPLLQLSITDQFDSDVRRRIRLRTDESYFNDFIDMCKEDDLLNKLREYKYSSPNFDFMNNPSIARLNINTANIRIDGIIAGIDLSPLSGLTEIGDIFLHNYFNLIYIDLSPLSRVKTIGRWFLLDCRNLKKIDSSPSQVETLGDDFVGNCYNLQEIDLTLLSQVKTIGHSFLRGCSSLTELSLAPLTKVQTIGDKFLSSCSKLQKIYSSPSQVETIGNYFANRCLNLQEIDLALLSQVKTIGHSFLLECTSLTELNMSLLSKVETIGHYFLQGCTSLTELNLSSLSEVKAIGNNFLILCSGLRKIHSSPSQVETVNDNFVYGCSNLQEIDLALLSRAKTIGNCFLCECTGLTELNLSSLSEVETIGGNFLSHCSELRKIHSSPSQVETIGSNFVDRCYNLREIDLTLLSQVKTIGHYFLRGCTGLTELRLAPLARVQTIGNNFLRECTGLTELDLSPLVNIRTIGNEFLRGCTKLTTVDLSGLSQLTHIGVSLLHECPNLHTVLCDQEQYELIKNSLVNKSVLRIK
jgi:hypothetical protein